MGKHRSQATHLANRLSQYGAYCGVIHEEGTKPYKYNHMQEEKLHKGSPQINGVFEYVCHKQSLDRELCHKQLYARKNNAWSNRTQVKNLKLGA